MIKRKEKSKGKVEAVTSNQKSSNSLSRQIAYYNAHDFNSLQKETVQFLSSSNPEEQT